MPHHAPLSSDALAAIARAEAALEDLEEWSHRHAHARLGWWALSSAWALSPPNVVWCISTMERFVVVGGGGWQGVLGYDPATLPGRKWSDLVATVDDVHASLEITAANIETGAGFVRFVNHYRHASGLTTHRVVWSASPWHEGHVVARGVVDQ